MARRYSLGLVALVFSGVCLVGCAAPRSPQDTESRLQNLENKVASFSDLRVRVDALEKATRAKGILEPALNTESLPPLPEQESKTPPHSDYVVSTLPGQKEVTKAPMANVQQTGGKGVVTKSTEQAAAKPVAQAEAKPQATQSGTGSPFAKAEGTPPPVVHVQERGATAGQPPLPKLDGETKPQAEGDLRQPQITPQPQQAKEQPKEQPKPQPRAQEKPAPKTEKGAYEAALALQDAGKYAESRKAMTAFLETYPASVYVPNALYWIGESHYSQLQWEQAILSFKDVVSRFPKHAKAADALLKLGMCYENLKDKDNARFHYEALTEDFPGSGAAKLAKARLAAL